MIDEVLVADKFEQSGIDGLKAAGCEVIYRARPEGRRADRRRSRDSGADVLVVRSTDGDRRRCSRPARLSLVVRAGAGYNTIDVAAASRRGIYVSNCPGKNADRGRRAGVRADPRARSARPRQRRRPARRHVEQEGVLEGARAVRPDARPARLRQHRPGDGAARATRSACRSSSGAAGSRPGQETRRRRSRFRCSSRASPAELARAQRRAERPPGAQRRRRSGLVNAAVLDKLKPGSYFINTARGEVVDYAALDEGGARARHPRRPRRVRRRAGRRDRRVQRSRSTRCRTSTARITSARPPIRRRKRSPPKPCASSRPTRTPARCRTS